jgi:hypothetical protein
VLGLGTALKVLLSPDDEASDMASEPKGYSLQRNEVVALVNTLAQVSKSVKSVREWRVRELRLALAELALRLAAAALAATLAALAAWRHRCSGSASSFSSSTDPLPQKDNVAQGSRSQK